MITSPVVGISPPGFSSPFSGPRNSFYQHTRHISPVEYLQGPGSAVRKTSKLHQFSRFSPAFLRLIGGTDRNMVKGSEANYNSYFAKSSSQSQRSERASSQASSANKSSRSSSTEGSVHADAQGRSPARNIPAADVIDNTARGHNSSLHSLANVPLHTRAPYSGYETASDSGSDSSISTSSSTTSTASTASSIASFLPESVLRQRKQEILDKLMAQFFALFSPWMEKTFGIECYDTGQYEYGASEAQGSESSRKRGSDTNKSSSTSKKRQARDNSDDEDQDFSNSQGDDGNGASGRKKSSNKRARRADKPRFACPYFKNDPDRYRSETTCCGPGWEDPHRVKEHMRRRHQRPAYMCNRCLESFQTEKHLNRHQRSQRNCILKEADEDDTRLTKSQMDELQKKMTGLTPRQKWEKMYSIAFPGEDLPESPYHEGEVSELVKFGEYISDELPIYISNQLRSAIDIRLEGVEAETKKILVENAPFISRWLLEHWGQRRRQKHLQQNSLTDPAPPRSSRDSSASSDHGCSHGDAAASAIPVLEDPAAPATVSMEGFWAGSSAPTPMYPTSSQSDFVPTIDQVTDQVNDFYSQLDWGAAVGELGDVVAMGAEAYNYGLPDSQGIYPSFC